MTETVGIRQLRQHLSRYTARTVRGESFEVTDRGQPVGRLVPPASGEPWLDALVASGVIRPARARTAVFPRPAERRDVSISDALAQQRADRRLP